MEECVGSLLRWKRGVDEKEREEVELSSGA
jgi:hypothetical protein